MRPADGCSSPTATLSSGDLPQPVGPTTDTNSPGATSSVVSLMAVYRAPSWETKVTVMSSSASAATTAALLLLAVLGVRFLDELVGVRLGEIDAFGLDRGVERRQRLERRLGSCLAEIPVPGIRRPHVVECEQVHRLVAEQVLFGHGGEDLLRRRGLHPEQRAHRGIGERRHGVRVLFPELDRRVEACRRHRSAEQLLCALRRRRPPAPRAFVFFFSGCSYTGAS